MAAATIYMWRQVCSCMLKQCISNITSVMLREAREQSNNSQRARKCWLLFCKGMMHARDGQAVLMHHKLQHSQTLMLE